MVNYLSRFNPNIANLMHNLRELLKKRLRSKMDSIFTHWTSTES